jgi:type II secretory pathway pseudopilin PulG
MYRAWRFRDDAQPQQHRHARPGFFLLEALVGFALFTMFIAAVGFSLLASYQGVTAASDRTRGVFEAERASEAVRTLRNTSFTYLSNGDHGVQIVNGQWQFTGVSSTNSGYTVRITIASPSPQWKQIDTRVSWNFGKNRSGSVLQTTYLTDWLAQTSIGNWAAPTQLAALTVTGATTIRDVLLSGSSAYVVGDTATPGQGILATINTDNSQMVVTSSGTFTGGGKALALRGNALYVLTGGASGEIRVYTLTDPLRPSNIATHDLPGSALGTSLAVRGNALLIGNQGDLTQAELSAYSIPSPSVFSLSGSINLTDGGAPIMVNSIAVQGGYAYLATSQDTAELRVASVMDVEQMTAQASSGYNLSDRSEDGLTIAMTGTATLVGTNGGSLISELALVRRTSVLPQSPPGPWLYEAGSGANPGADVRDVALEPGGRYAFLAVNGDRDLQILNLASLQNGLAAQLYSRTVSEFGRAVSYDMLIDRLIFATDSVVYLFRPG